MKIDSPVTLLFGLLLLLVQFLYPEAESVIGGYFKFVGFGELDTMAIVSSVTHVFGYTGWDSVLFYLCFILILGPLVEKKFGSTAVLSIIIIAPVLASLLSVLFPSVWEARVPLYGSVSIIFALALLVPLSNHGRSVNLFTLGIIVFFALRAYNFWEVSGSYMMVIQLVAGGIVGLIGIAIHQVDREEAHVDIRTIVFPVMLGFVGLILGIHAINEFTDVDPSDITQGSLTGYVVFRGELDFRMLSHVLGHANWGHATSNLFYLILLGPALESRYGSTKLLVMIVFTAVITGVWHVLLTGAGLYGASGIVFMMMILAPFTTRKGEGVPLTLVLVAAIYLFKEYLLIGSGDNIAHTAHLIGGLCGGVAGVLSSPS